MSLNNTEDIDKIERAMNELRRSLSRHDLWDHLFAEVGGSMDRSGAMLLQILAYENNPRMLDMAKRLGIEAPSVTRKVQQLEELGYVVRTTDPEDKRASRLALTQKGKKIVDKLQVVKRKYFATVLEEWSKDDLHELARLIDKLAENARNIDISSLKRKEQK